MVVSTHIHGKKRRFALQIVSLQCHLALEREDEVSFIVSDAQKVSEPD